MMLAGMQPSTGYSQYDEYGFPNIPEVYVILITKQKLITSDKELVQSCIDVTIEYNEIKNSNNAEQKRTQHYMNLGSDKAVCDKTIMNIFPYCMILGVCKEIKQYNEIR